MPTIDYHLAELGIARDPSRPEHMLPDLTACRLGVADVGCGIGQLFVARESQLRRDVARYGFDIDAAAIDYARQHWPGLALFAVAPAERLPLADRSVDLYVSRVALPYADIRRALSEAARVLVPGGRAWMSLHARAMVAGEIRRSLRRLRLRDAAVQTVAWCNGLGFHLFGTGRRILGVRESWQSESRIRRLLDTTGFEQVRVTTGSHFVVEAVRRS